MLMPVGDAMYHWLQMTHELSEHDTVWLDMKHLKEDYKEYSMADFSWPLMFSLMSYATNLIIY
jgi:hypothetical protein